MFGSKKMKFTGMKKGTKRTGVLSGAFRGLAVAAGAALLAACTTSTPEMVSCRNAFWRAMSVRERS